jgi:hypothetical protein
VICSLQEGSYEVKKHDSKAKSYPLPLKSEIRKKEAIAVGSLLIIKLQLESVAGAKKDKLDTSKPKMWS